MENKRARRSPKVCFWGFPKEIRHVRLNPQGEPQGLWNTGDSWHEERKFLGQLPISGVTFGDQLS